MNSQVNRVIVYGARGALGQACVSAFKKCNWWVLSIDLDRAASSTSCVGDSGKLESDSSVLIKNEYSNSWLEQEENIVNETGKILGHEKIQAIICVAGGWAGGNAASKELVKNSDLMIKKSIWPSVITARLANLYLADNGLVVLTGAKPAQGGTPSMIGYGLAKAAVLQLTKSLASNGSGLPANSIAVAILPSTLDTPMNRKWMPDANFAEWTPLEYVTGLFVDWITGKNRPKSGSYVILDGENSTIIE